MALWTTEVPFHRPSSSVFFRLGNLLMPPQPRGQDRLGFGELKDHFRIRHYLVGLPMLLAFFWIVQQERRLWHGFNWSPFSLFFDGFDWAHHKGWPWIIVYVFTVSRLRKLVPGQTRGGHSAYADHTVGLLSRGAVAEEQWFREGMENWSQWGRFRSAFAFGIVHMANLIYPLSTILPLTLAGLVFNQVYLRAYRRTGSRERAVLASSVVHRVYNRLALIALVLWIGHDLFGGLLDYFPQL